MTTALDLFAGLGGTALGLEQQGVKVLWAGNHCPDAVFWHSRNFPTAFHVCQDMHQANFYEAPDADLVAGSPSCKGNTPARGKEQEHHDTERATAWAVLSAAEAKRPPVVMVENVPGMRNWALYKVWRAGWEALGYSYAEYVLNVADFGLPQDRVRLIGVATKSRHPIELKFEFRQPRPVSEFIRWDDYAWSPVAAKVENTRSRVASGRASLGEVFVMPYYGSGSGLTGRSIDRPLGTITTKARWAIVRGDLMRMFQPAEIKAIMGFPQTYQIPTNVELANRLLGNANPPALAAGVLKAIQKAA